MENSNISARMAAMASLIARCPGMFAEKRSHRQFIPDVDRLKKWCAHWRDKRAVHGIGRPMEVVEKSHGCQAQYVQMNEQHQAWFTKKFGHPDPNCFTYADAS